MLDYKTCKQLKEAGFSQEINDGSFYYVLIGPQQEPRRFCWGGEGEDKPYGEYVLDPTLSQLIDACEDKFYFRLDGYMDEWRARMSGHKGEKDFHIEFLEKTKEGAVAKLYLKLNRVGSQKKEDVV